MPPTNAESADGDDRSAARPDADPNDRGPDDCGTSPAVAVEGRDRIVVSASQIDGFPRATQTCTVECASGVRATDEWTGVPIDALAAATDFPGETTHLRVEADDFTAEVPIRSALDGILAFERRAGRDGDEEGLPRLIAEDVAGERLVKRVERIAAVALDAGEEPRVG
ncbi:molybdopterin-dependent oxidoreductase [Halorussus lipolyticus]|uniref:molybdopterin-dependent oxidoreductase n=1 Tax=Halorussus lipolyticus TaxID=3034024 RepID=UPI0023E85937|nr:molybdopterin-dependent oxidoreductase [Halorussus sp. DT80]